MPQDTEEWYIVRGKTDLLFKKWQEFREFWPEHSHVSEICTLIGSLCKVYNNWPKEVQRSYLSWHSRVMQIWRKTDWWFAKWNEKFDNFHQNTWKCQNWEFDGILLLKVENTCTKIYREVMANNTEEWWKNWRGINLLFQNWGIWRIWPKHLKVSKIWTLMAGSFWVKFIMFELKKYWGAIFLDTEKWCEIWWGTDLLFQDWHEEVEEFWSKHTKGW